MTDNIAATGETHSDEQQSVAATTSARLSANATLPEVIAWAIAYATAHGRKPRLRVSVSGGRTSARMAWLIKLHLSQYFEILYLFANTGREHPDTLRYVHDVDLHLGLNLVWIEAVVHMGERKACTHKVVNYETASRNGEPFMAVCAKYGIPNQTFKLCTRDLKTNPMESYAESVGWVNGSYHTAIGIRADEPRRVKDKAIAQFIAYPLAHWWPMDKQDVLDFWEDFDWDLTIQEREGNCIDCHKKSDKKLALLAQEHPEYFTFPIMLDRLYENVGPNNVPGPRKRYRGYMSTLEKLATFQGVNVSSIIDDGASGGCTESCELYETEEMAA
jgi:3'-phosphoadenosine 5'-phosphosulfate sulfotransferase (PAPS reductase)/FAD synthetase